MTLEKLQRMMQQVDELNIDTEERLKGCIDVIFEKVDNRLLSLLLSLSYVVVSSEFRSKYQPADDKSSLKRAWSLRLM